MDDLIYWILGIGIGVIIALVGVVYRNLKEKIDNLTLLSKNGLALKVDNIVYRVEKEWQQSLYEDVRITVKELKNENNEQHKGILLELQRIIKS